jgi:nucleoid-associated protein YgaU
MATPQPETDNSLPRRAAFQSPVALGAAAGGEKTAGTENELTKPAPRTSFAASAALNAPLPSLASAPAMPKAAAAPRINDPAPAAEPVEKAATPAVPDWGLSKKKPRGRGRLKLIATALVLAGVGGGYVAYIQFYEKNAAIETSAVSPEDERQDSATGDDPRDSLSSPDSLDDPFDDDPPVRAVSTRSQGKLEPGRVGLSPGAVPIDRRKVSKRPSRRNPLRESLALDDDGAPEIADDANSLRLDQSEPDVGSETSGRSRGQPAATPRRPGSVEDRDPAAEGPSSRNPRSSGGPRLLEVADDGDTDHQPPDERLDGYRMSGQRARPTSRKNAGGPAISIVEARDDQEQNEKLEGYAPQSATTRRATSKTVVVRPVEGFGDDEPLARENASDHRISRPGQSPLNAADHRGALPPSADRRLSSASRSPGSRDETSDPASETYRVAPDDNFWKISRSQYGTSRYYQALMRHNRERVPDPQKLRPGTQIMTPPAAVLELRYPDLIDKPAPSALPSKGALERSAMRPAFERPTRFDDDADERATRVDREEAASGYFYGRSGEPLYRVGADDTLGGIAQRHLGRASRWHEIFEKNQDVLKTPDNLTLGTVIRLPADASRLGLAPEADRRR